ncbi:cache domain-containing protein [Marinomonas ostreistagni]|uniref:Cache domain-containing protein n=1 Tax=Marinomonas ostreistagni TaxID=359209 RepID=A0ABS0ZEI1_9GAMM|nr:cache domain-containing protein [Marinomonas ostreistagni]MBJ7551316.1 cache domain-containing protein [Marinomonas ostreistagni]
METFLSSYENKLKSWIYDVNYYEKNLKSLSSWWARIALLGKINSLDVAATILDDMDSARSRFHQLQDSLIENLIQQHGRKALLHHQTRSQMAIDVLIRNLFERTADIGFLSDDQVVGAFLNQTEHSKEDCLAIRQHLQNYVDKYTVYNDALLITPTGEIVFQLSQQSTRSIKEPVIDKAIRQSSGYVEYFGKSALIEDGNDHLFYAHKVTYQGKVVGVVVLSFRFRNEMHAIFDTLISENDSTIYVLTDDTGKVIFQKSQAGGGYVQHLNTKDDISLVHYNGQEMLLINTLGNAYQGYSGPKGWRACALMPLSLFKSRSDSSDINFEKLPPLKNLSGIFSSDLLDIRDRSTLINNDLELIVLNGVITAARNDSAEFMPVLEAIKNIGRDIDSVFADSIESLFSTILSSQLDETRLHAEMAVDVMDRNLYERANDCRWWASDPRIGEALLEKPVNHSLINEILQDIHGLYTVYHDLYVFDGEKKYVSTSLNNQAYCGEKVAESTAVSATFSLRDLQAYSVSNFVPCSLYNGQSTYVYNGAIRHPERQNEVIGGVGTVFDATQEFRAILKDVLPAASKERESASFAVFTNDEGEVISCSDDRLAVGTLFFPDIDLQLLKEQGSLSEVYEYKSQYYLLGAALSKGYREFKNDDGYVNPVIAWVMQPC